MAATYGAIQLMSGDESLTLKEISIASVVVGMIANVKVELTFANKFGKVVEGELDFPLPENAIVCGYAFSIDGHLFPASVVEKEEARIAFEKEVRSGNATSLVEHVKGNSFKVRVYPIHPSFDTKVQLEFQSELLSSSNNKYQLELPFVLVEPAIVNIKIDVQKFKQQPEIECNVELDFHKQGDNWKAQASRSNVKLEKLRLEIPKNISSEIFIGEKDLGAKGIETYFLIQDFPEVDKLTANSSSQSLKCVENAIIFWDSSFSFSSIDRTREFSLLSSLLKEAKKIDIVVFSNTQDAIKSFTDKSNAIHFLSNEVIYDGGTDIQHISFPSNGYDKIFWFTDGLSTLSGDLPSQVPKIPVYIFINAPKNNIKYMNYFASKTGGSCFNLIQMTDDEIVKEVNKSNRFHFLSATVNEKAISDVFPANPIAISQGESLRISGKLLSDEATIILNYGFNNNHILESKKYVLKKSDSVGLSPIVPRVWAQKKIDEISLIDSAENKKEMLKLGRRYGIVTPNASLLVLTSLEQYLKHKIKPSKELLPHLHDQYTQRKKAVQTDEENKKKAKIEKVAGYWSERVRWWKREYVNEVKDIFRQQWQSNLPKEDREDPPAVRALPGKHTAKLTSQEAKKQATKIEPPKSKISYVENESKKPQSNKSEQKSLSPAPASASHFSSPNLAMDDAPIQMEKEKSVKEKKVAKKEKDSASFKKKSVMKKSAKAEESEEAQEEGEASEKSDSEEKSESAPSTKIDVSIKGWTPDVPYIREIQAKSTPQEQYKEYIRQRSSYTTSPAFYLDCCTYFFNSKMKEIGVRIITSIADMKLEDHRLLRIIANQLYQEGVFDQSLWLFEKIVKLRGEEPQSYRELGLVHSDLKHYQKALELYYKVITGDWPIRFQHIEDEVLMEINRTIWLAQKSNVNINTSFIDKRFLVSLPVDVKLVISWDQDDLCIDLHIFEPDGGKSYYGNHCTHIGGWSSPDYPGCTAYSTSMLREYMIKNGLPGTYRVCTNFYSNYKQDLTGGTTIWFTVFTNYMKENEQKTTTVLRVTSASPVPTYQSMSEIGKMDFGVGPEFQKYVAEWEKELVSRRAKWSAYKEKAAKVEEEWAKWNKEEQEIVEYNKKKIEQAQK